MGYISLAKAKPNSGKCKEGEGGASDKAENEVWAAEVLAKNAPVHTLRCTSPHGMSWGDSLVTASLRVRVRRGV